MARLTIAHGALEDVALAKIAQKMADDERDAARAQLKTAQGNEAQLKAALAAASASIDALGRDSAVRVEKSQAALNAEQAKRKSIQTQLDAISGALIDANSPAAAALSVDELMKGVR